MNGVVPVPYAVCHIYSISIDYYLFKKDHFKRVFIMMIDRFSKVLLRKMVLYLN